MNKTQPNSSRARLRELLAIPERQRTEAQWDEINELEIAMAPGNREGAPMQGQPRRHGGMMPSNYNSQQPGGGAPHGKKKPMKKFHKRPSKGHAPR